MGGCSFVDEAFIELADPRESLVDVREQPLFVLRSLTKSFAVPGIRFGYGFGDPDLIAKIETARPPWSVNAYAESFALEAFLHLDELETARAYIQKNGTGFLCRSKNSASRCHAVISQLPARGLRPDSRAAVYAAGIARHPRP